MKSTFLILVGILLMKEYQAFENFKRYNFKFTRLFSDSRDVIQPAEERSLSNEMLLVPQTILGSDEESVIDLGSQYLKLKSSESTSSKLEKCIVVAVDAKADRGSLEGIDVEKMTVRESLKELQELLKTAGLRVTGCCVQRLQAPHSATYIGSGKVEEILFLAKKLETNTLIFDDDLSPKQQKNLEEMFESYPGGSMIKIIDRTAVILEIFAQRARTREGQLQVELAQLEYRLTRGPRATGTDRDLGCGFRGPGESKLETDKRVIKEKILLLKKEIDKIQSQRSQHRKGRESLGIPVVTLCGYTNAGKSTLMNSLSQAGVLAEDKLFATLDPTTRKVKLPSRQDSDMVNESGSKNRREFLLTDTVGFISKLPTSLIAAFRSSLAQVVLI